MFYILFFFFSSRRRHTSCALVTGVQTCALPILARAFEYAVAYRCPRVHVVAGVEKPGMDRRAMEACYMDNLAWAAEQAAALDIMLLIEPINRRDEIGRASVGKECVSTFSDRVSPHH